MGKPVTMGLLFYPRGGSAQVARYLAEALDRKGWPVRLFTGSLGEPGAVANAATFFAGLDLVAADFTPRNRQMGIASASAPQASEDQPRKPEVERHLYCAASSTRP